MKKTPLALFVLALSLVASCKKDDNKSSDNNNSTSTLTCKMNGSTWTSEGSGSFYMIAGRHTYIFSQYKGGGQFETLTFTLGGPSPFILTDTSAGYITFNRTVAGTPEAFRSDSGIVELSGGAATNYRIESTFNARLKNGSAALNITDGHFIHTLR